MKNEAGVVRKIKDAFKKKLPRAVVFKINDLSTSGIPDLSITYKQRHTWVEVKNLDANETPSGFKKKIDPLQNATARLLQAQGTCYYFIAYPFMGKDYAVIITPEDAGKWREDYKDITSWPNPIFLGTLEDAINRLVEEA